MLNLIKVNSGLSALLFLGAKKSSIRETKEMYMLDGQTHNSLLQLFIFTLSKYNSVIQMRHRREHPGDYEGQSHELV